MKSSRFNLLAIFGGAGLLIFFVTRLVLLSLSWQQIEPSLPALLLVFGRGLLFDLGFLAYALILPALYLWLLPERFWHLRAQRFALKGILFVGLYFLGFIAVAEYFFWDEFSVRFNFIAIDYLIYQREVANNILESYSILPLLTGLLAATTVLFYLMRRSVDRALATKESLLRRSRFAILLLFFPLITFFGLGQQLRNPSNNVYYNELGSNGPYQFVAAFRNNELDYQQFYASLPVEQTSTILREAVAEPNARFISDEPFDIRRDISATGPEKRHNIVLIMVESLSSDFLKYFGNSRNLTPNLDALIDKSLFFTNFYATGTRTTRGLEAVTLSMPPTPGRSIVKRIGREGDQWSLGNVLNTKGYQSFFVYGGRGYFDNMGAFFRSNGYQVVDQSTVPDNETDFTNAWGMSDADLYRQAIRIADQSHAEAQPFFLHLLTTSNHRPYTYPEGKVDIASGKNRDGAVKYTDYAIGEFLANAAEQPWFDDTLFIIVADHQAGSAGKRALPVERYHIPLWVYAPRHIAPSKVATLSSQIDLAPTLLGLLNMSYQSVAFGKNILNMAPDQGRALIGNYQNLGLFDGRGLAILSPQRRMQLQEGFDSGSIIEHSAQKAESLIQRDISYYQGAAYVYRNRLNAWTGPVAGVTHARVQSKRPWPALQGGRNG